MTRISTRNVLFLSVFSVYSLSSLTSAQGAERSAVVAGKQAGPRVGKIRSQPTPKRTSAASKRGHQSMKSAEGENVTVTRRRVAFGRGREQHVGVSSTYISKDTLAQHQVVDVKGLMNLAPNLTVQPQGGSSGVNFTLRGIGFRDFTFNNTPSVMTYVDDVALPIGYMSGAALFDLSGVDVQTGPVGFSHGQTVTAGELNIKTADPTKDFHYGASQDLATYARSITNLYVSGSITDKLQYRIAGYTQHGGGFQKSLYNGEMLGNANKGAIRAKLAWQPDEKTDVKVTGIWAQDNSEAMGAFNVQDSGHGIPSYQNNLKTGWGFRPEFLKLTGNEGANKPFYNNTFWGATLAATRELGFAQLTTTSSFQQMYIHNLMDLDATPRAIYDDNVNTNGNLFSQEVRLHSEKPNSRVQWAVGMYYNRTQLKSSFFNDYTESVTRPFMIRTSYRQNQQAFSQYGRVRFAVTSKLHLIAGLSHESDDRRLLDMETKRYRTASYPVNWDNHYPNFGALTNQFAGMGGIEYQVLPNVLLYGNIRKGFKPGGFTANNTVVAAQLTPTKPESLLAYEVGFKTDFFNHKLRFNTDAFWYDYHGQQIMGLQVIPNYGTVGQYINIPKSQIWGVETEIDINPLRNFYIEQHIGYERGVYKDLNMVNSSAVTAYYQKTGEFKPFYDNYSGVDSGIPKLTLNGNANYKAHVAGGWVLTPYMAWSYRGSQLDMPGNPVYRMAPYFLLDAGLTWAPSNNKWSLTVYSTNLLDRHYDLTRELGLNAYYGTPGTPRMVGGRFRIDL